MYSLPLTYIASQFKSYFSLIVYKENQFMMFLVKVWIKTKKLINTERINIHFPLLSIGKISSDNSTIYHNSTQYTLREGTK